MRRCTEFERIHQEAKLLFSLFRCEAKQFEHLVLQFAVVDTDRATTNFYAIDNHVVGISAHSTWVGVEQWNIFWFRRCEWVVHSIEALVLFAPLKEREVHNPKARVVVFVAQTELATHFKTKFAQLFASFVSIVARKDKDKVAWLSIHRSAELLEHLLSVEFINARFHRAISLNASIYHTFCADLWTFHKVSESIELFASVSSSTFSADTADIFSRVEHRETMTFQHIHQLNETHFEASIRFVRTIIFHSIVPSHARECVEFDAFDSAEKVTAHAFKHLDNILLFNETHFAVDLRKFRLTVSAKVLVAETFHDLEVTVETTHHQQLFESLRRLRQSIELTLIHTARHHEVASTFRCRFDEHRSFHFDKALSIEVTTHFERHFVAKFEVSAHRVTTKVEVAILHTDVVATVSFVLNSERRSSRHVEHSHLIYNDFDVASSHFIIFSRTLSHSTTHL